MKNSVFLVVLLIVSGISNNAAAQINEEKLGAWYMYFFDHSFKESNWGVQGDVQYRSWDSGADLEQLMVRAGFTYKPVNANIKFTLGYASITSGIYGDSDSTYIESRVYQEALFPVKLGKRFYTNHRFRYEQRFLINQELRTRYRYNFFLNVPLNKPDMKENAIYLALYNELFINGERHFGNGNMVEIFDRNRFYCAVGYMITDGMKLQAGIMNQATDTWKKNQFQFSFHHKF